ncbi:MAG: ATP-binding protein [Rubripirellula sp.]
MKRFQNLPIPTKLTLLNGSTITLALVVATCVSLMYNARTTKRAKVQQLTTLAEVLASNCAAAVSFGQSQSAEQLLDSLQFYPTVTSAVILDGEGKLFANYSQPGHETWQIANGNVAGIQFSDEGYAEILVPIIDNGDAIGKFGLRDSLVDLEQAYWGNVRASIIIVALSLILGIFVAIPLQHSISHPLIRLSTAAKQITHEMDFSLRVTHESRDEIGVLYQQFNTMIQRVEQSDHETRKARNDLEKLNVDLERRVKSRTEQLEMTNANLEQNISARDAANKQLKEAQTQLIETSRKAGMADIANGVLHNIGNVLNSLNVATVVAKDKIQGIPIGLLVQVVELLDANQADIGNFMANSNQGKKLPGFLSAITKRLQSSQTEIETEVQSVLKHVDHIKEIVRAQQSLAGARGVTESCQADELFEDALQFLSDSVKRHGIELIRDYAELSPIRVEKAKIIQMLVNLIKNAKESILQHGGTQACVTVRSFQVDADSIGLQVIDTGVGISQDQLTKIFSQGFTTKKDGHGFGLHASANLAKELGGSLQVTSDGLGHGASFTISIPCEPFAGRLSENRSPENNSALLEDAPASLIMPNIQNAYGARELEGKVHD